jgi:protein-disulfide isomerase
VSAPRISSRKWIPLIALLGWPLLAGASCKSASSDSSPKASADPAEILKAEDAAHKGSGAGTGSGSASGSAMVVTKVDSTPLVGVDLGKLSDEKKTSFYKMVDLLPSPCGKAHSLRTSFNTDKTCKRAPFAVKYIVSLLEDEATEDQVKEEFDFHYKPAKQYQFKIDAGVPYAGDPHSKLVFVEFFDYGCPACRDFKPMLDEVLKEHGSDIVVYYKMFPLVHKHPNSMSAAKASIAAMAQGKFHEMHDLLFVKDPEDHVRDGVVDMAKSLGLDVDRFQTDYDAAEPRVKTDMDEGEASDVDATPTLFFQGHKYQGPMHPKYIGMWIDEEKAVNQ